jgi:hypothetical protein
MEHTPTNEPIEGVLSIEGYTQSAGTGFKESLLLTVNPEAEFVDPDEDLSRRCRPGARLSCGSTRTPGGRPS